MVGFDASCHGLACMIGGAPRLLSVAVSVTSGEFDPGCLVFSG